MARTTRYYDSDYTLKGKHDDLQILAEVWEEDDHATVTFRSTDGSTVRIKADAQMLRSLSGYMATIQNAIERQEAHHADAAN